MRIPREVLEELEAVRLYTRTDVLDIPLLRYVAMEREKPALVVWIDKHESGYGRGLLDGFQAEDRSAPGDPQGTRRGEHGRGARGGQGCSEGGVDEESLRLLKAMRGQLGEASASRAVDAAVAANSLGMDMGTLDFHRSLHDLVGAGYLEEPASPARATRGTYLITFEGIAAADDT